MKLEKARKNVHLMKSSLSVVMHFVSLFTPTDDERRRHKEVAEENVSRAVTALKELDVLLNKEVLRKRMSESGTIWLGTKGIID